MYDATGLKLRRIVTNTSVAPVKVTTTDYLDGFIYKNDTLLSFDHESGRVRMVYKANATPAPAYDYFITDHLGSVRTVLTEQTDFTMYTATMETERAEIETVLFSNLDGTRSNKPVGYPQDERAGGNNAFVARLNAGNEQKIGPSLVLRVMAGDTIQISTRAFYKSIGPQNNKKVTPEDMVASLIHALGGDVTDNAAHGLARADMVSPLAGNFTGNDYQRLKERDEDHTQTDRPRAYLNYVLFDDQFKLVDENSGVRQVKGTPDELQTLQVEKMAISKSGFLYVYSSNETPQDVYFDNLTVMGITGPVLEETQYYPEGLPDPAGQFASPYLAMGNNWPRATDPSGQWALFDDLAALFIGGVVNLISNIGNIDNFWDGLSYFAIGALSGETTLYGGPLAGGAVLGLGNSVTTQLTTTGSIDLLQTAIGTTTGAITGYAGAQASVALSPVLGKVTAGIGSPVLQGAIQKGLGGAVVGFGIGAGASLAMGGDFRSSLQQGGQGAIMGFGTGAITGGVMGYRNVRATEHNPWTEDLRVLSNHCK